MTTAATIIEHRPGPEDGLPVGGDCWNRIGVNGDRSCPELTSFVHCRNCPVFAAAARSFFDRPAPEDTSPTGRDGWPTPTD